MFAIAAGAYDVALVMGADKVRETASRGSIWEWVPMAQDMAWDYPLGLVAPAGVALHLRRYLHESTATREHMGLIAVKNHRHGVTNPKARLRFEITLEEVLAAPVVSPPIGAFDCAPQSDGAAAVILAAEDVVDRFTDRPVWIRGVGPRPGFRHASAQARHDHVPVPRCGPPSRLSPWRALHRRTLM